MVATIDQALAKKGETLKALDVWKETMPTEAEMLPKDKYTMFDRKEKRYRKGIHSRFWKFGYAVYGDDADLGGFPFCRAAEMDKSVTTIKPAGLLRRLYYIRLGLRNELVPAKKPDRDTSWMTTTTGLGEDIASLFERSRLCIQYCTNLAEKVFSHDTSYRAKMPHDRNDRLY